LVLRGDLSGDPGFAELVRRTRAVAVGAFENQDLPFERLVDELRPERNLSHTPLCQVMLSMQDTPREMPQLPELEWGLLEVETHAARFDLTLSLTATSAGLVMAAEYDTDLFDAPRIQRMLGHYRTLLAGAVADPERRLSDLPLLAAAERHQLLAGWN